MKTIVIPQFYCGPSGQKGMYNRQEVGLARAFAALGARAVVLYPAPGRRRPPGRGARAQRPRLRDAGVGAGVAGVLQELAGAAG